MLKSNRIPLEGSLRRAPFLAAAALGLFMLCGSAVSGATVSARLGRTTIQDGETLTLTIESDEAQSREQPDLSPLRKDFDILGTSAGSETSIINGSRTDRTRWLVQLRPRRTGTLDVPSIAVGSDHTVPLRLEVTEPSSQAANQASKRVFIEVETAAGSSIYVQQQIPYTVRLYYDDTIQKGELTAPDPADAVVEQLGEEKHYTAMHDGREYSVIERRYAIAPEKSGALHIPPVSFRGSAIPAQNPQDRADPTDDLMARLTRNTPFANDPFFKGLGAGMAFAEPQQPVVAHGREITLDVLPRPAGARSNWLPAEQITLRDSWQDNPPRFKVGEPATRTITVEAKGLAAPQIPPLSFAQPTNARLYPEAPANQSRTDGETLYGVSKQSVTYIPTAKGTLEVPPVELAWWNTRSHAQSRVALPAREFKVEPGATQSQSSAAPPEPAGQPTQAAAPAAPVVDHPRQSASLMEPIQNRWILAAGGLGLLALVTLSGVFALRSRRRGSKAAQPAATSAPAPQKKSVLRALQQACVANDGHAAARALLDLAQAQWPKDPPRGLGALAARLEAGGEEIRTLERSLYGAGETLWKGDALWGALRGGLKPRRSGAPREHDSLGALYP
jgi:hypothetical protein